MGRLTIFAKGNLDLRDSLLVFRSGGEARWNGVNDILRQRRSGDVARVRHETWTRTDALLESSGRPPPDLAARAPHLQAHSPASQFSRAVFDGKSDVIVLSIQPDVMVTKLGRHRGEGYLLFPDHIGEWPQTDRAWFRSAFDPVGALDCEQSMGNFETIIAKLRETSTAPILIYNMSAVVPGDTTHIHPHGPDSLATRIRRFNLALIALSRSTGVSIIDVDALIARGGADRLKIDHAHFTAEGCAKVAGEVVRVLEDLGTLPLGGDGTAARP